MGLLLSGAFASCFPSPADLCLLWRLLHHPAALLELPSNYKLLLPSPQVYAVYGGFFIILSYLWGWAVDGTRPDTGDWVGSAIAVAGACVAFFWPGR